MMLWGSVTSSYACEVRKSSLPEPETFLRHLVGPCTSKERADLAISSDEIFQAILEGKHVDLSGVIVTGDLMFDQLPVRSLDAVSLSSRVAQQVLSQRNISSGRVVEGSISIHDAELQGSWATNLRNEVIVFVGEVHLTHTTFQQSVDFSQAMFLKTVNFSDSVILYEGFFIRSHFMERAIFDGVAFGTHSRFHKARFAQEASFLGSQFHGVAEFLEVVFEQKVSFKNGHFEMGTGFSGAQFSGPAVFENAIFSREVYFRFAKFSQKTDFREATFREVSDFMNAQFSEERDFSNVDFQVLPEFTGTVLEGKWIPGNTNNALSNRLSIGFAVLGMLCILAWGVRKWRDSSL